MLFSTVREGGGQLQVAPGTEAVARSDATVSLVVRLCVAGPHWATFQHNLALFLVECAKFEGHLDVSMIKEESAAGAPPDSHSLVNIHKFSSYTALKRFLGSKLRNEWDARLRPWLARDPEFVSYSGFTSFFTLGRGIGVQSGGPPGPPPPKWKVGGVVFLSGILWAFCLDALEFPPYVGRTFSNRWHQDVVITAVNLLVVCFVLAPLLLQWLGCWLGAPSWAPKGTDPVSALLRWLFF